MSPEFTEGRKCHHGAYRWWKGGRRPYLALNLSQLLGRTSDYSITARGWLSRTSYEKHDYSWLQIPPGSTKRSPPHSQHPAHELSHRSRSFHCCGRATNRWQSRPSLKIYSKNFDLYRQPPDALPILLAMVIISRSSSIISAVTVSKCKYAIVPKTKPRNQPDASELVPGPFTDKTSVWAGGGSRGVCGLAFLRSTCW